MTYPVSIETCANYSQAEVMEAVKKLLAPLGGMGAFINSGDRVLIKPNMLSSKSPEKAATTHPEVLKAVTILCQQLGATVTIGDSPPMIFGRADEFWKNTGYSEVAKATGAQLIEFEKLPKKAIKCKICGKNFLISITSAYFEADKVINLPKMKTHNLTRITGAVKNLYGLIPGMQKAQLHKDFPRSDSFGILMSELAAKLPVTLNIMDGIVAMDGQGPAGGNQFHAGILLASPNPVALDYAFCKLVNIAPETVSILKHCKSLNFGPSNFNEIKILQNHWPSIPTGFVLPPKPISEKLPDILIELVKKILWAGPALKEYSCIECGRCLKICPADAIKLSPQACFDKAKCISCFCCMEVCPVDAIKMKTSPLLSIALKLREWKKRNREKRQ